MNLIEAQDAGIIRGWEHGARTATYGNLGLYPGDLCPFTVWQHGHDRKLAFGDGFSLGLQRWEAGQKPDGTPREEPELPTGESTGPYRYLVFSGRDNDPRGVYGPFDSVEAVQRKVRASTTAEAYHMVWVADSAGRLLLAGYRSWGSSRSWKFVPVEGKRAYPVPTPEVRLPMSASRQPDVTWLDGAGLWHASVPGGDDQEEAARNAIIAELTPRDERIGGNAVLAVGREVDVTLLSTGGGKAVYRELQEPVAVVRIDLLTPAGAPSPTQAAVWYRTDDDGWRHAVTARKPSPVLPWILAESSLPLVKVAAVRYNADSWVRSLRAVTDRLRSQEGYRMLERVLGEELDKYDPVTGGEAPASGHEEATQPAKATYGYIALYGDKRHDLHAGSLYEAKRKAIEHFRPPKSRQHLVTVHLAEIDGEAVTQVITS